MIISLGLCEAAQRLKQRFECIQSPCLIALVIIVTLLSEVNHLAVKFFS